MGLNPEVEIVDFMTGTSIKKLPSFTSLPSKDDILALSDNGGPVVNYEVKRVTHVLNTQSVTGTGGSTSYHANGYVKIEVSPA